MSWGCPNGSCGDEASVWSQGDKDEPVQSSQTGAGCSGAQISQLPRSQGESRLLEPQVTPTLPPVCCYLVLRKSLTLPRAALKYRLKMTLDF